MKSFKITLFTFALFCASVQAPKDVPTLNVSFGNNGGTGVISVADWYDLADYHPDESTPHIGTPRGWDLSVPFNEMPRRSSGTLTPRSFVRYCEAKNELFGHFPKALVDQYVEALSRM